MLYRTPQSLTSAPNLVPIFAKRFETDTQIDILDGVAGDFRRIIVRGKVLATSAGSRLYLQPSDTAGGSWKTSGYQTNILQVNNSPTTTPAYLGVYYDDNTAWQGMIAAGNISAAKWLDFEYELIQPNEVMGEQNFRCRSTSETDPGSTFYTNYVSGRISMGPINALRLLISAGTIRGFVEVFGERHPDKWPLTKPTYRVGLVGASLTSYQAGWDGALRTALQAAKPDKDVIVRNFAQGSTDTKWGLWNAKTVIAAGCDVAIIEFAQADSFTGGGIGMTLAESTTRTQQLCDQFKAAGIVPYLMTGSPMTTGLLTRPDQLNFNQVYRNVAGNFATTGIGLIDTYPLFGDPNLMTFQNGDGIHPIPALNIGVKVPAVVAALT